MATEGTWPLRRSARIVSRAVPIAASSRRSRAIFVRIRRRSVSIFVSPGPRVPMPPPCEPTRPPACRDIDSPQPRSRGSMYCICASCTCALPSRLFACWAKMSRISAVRSITLTLTTSSSWISWPGVSSPSQMTVSAPVDRTTSRTSRALPEPMYVAGSGRSRRCTRPSSTSDPAVSARAASSRSDVSASWTVPSVHTPTSTTRSRRSCRYSTSVTSCELGGQARDAAQGLAVGEVLLRLVEAGVVGVGVRLAHDPPRVARRARCAPTISSPSASSASSASSRTSYARAAAASVASSTCGASRPVRRRVLERPGPAEEDRVRLAAGAGQDRLQRGQATGQHRGDVQSTAVLAQELERVREPGRVVRRQRERPPGGEQGQAGHVRLPRHRQRQVRQPAEPGHPVESGPAPLVAGLRVPQTGRADVRHGLQRGLPADPHDLGRVERDHRGDDVRVAPDRAGRRGRRSTTSRSRRSPARRPRPWRTGRS